MFAKVSFSGGTVDDLSRLTDEAVSARLGGRFTAAMAAIAECHSILRALPEPEIAEARETIASMRLQWATTTALAGEMVASLQGFQRCAEEAEQTADAALLARACSAVAVIHAVAGNMTTAQGWLVRSRNHAETPLVDALIESIRGVDRLRLDDAQRSLRASSELVSTEMWALQATTHARLAAVAGTALTGLATLRAACLAHFSGSWAAGSNFVMIGLAQAQLQLTDGNIHAAKVTLGMLRPTDPLMKELVSATSVWIHLRAGEVVSAKAIALPYIESRRASLSLRAYANFILVAAAAHFATDEQEQAADLFTAATDLIEQEHLFSLLTQLSPDEKSAYAMLLPTRLTPEIRMALAQTGTITATSPLFARLTDREHVILVHLVGGLSTKQVCSLEFISPNTAKTHIRNIYRKLGVSTRAEALRAAIVHPELTAPRSALE